MAQFKKPSKKATIITAAIIVILLIIAATGTVVFLRDRGQTEAFEANQVGTQSAEGTQNEEQVATGEEQTTPEEPEGTEGEVATEGEEGTDVAGTTEGTTIGTGTAGTTTTTATEEIEESTITRTETVDVITPWERQNLGWTSSGVSADFAGAVLANLDEVQEDDVQIEKTATTKTGEGLVQEGEEITYTITVTNNSEKDVEVKDKIPKQTTFVDGSAVNAEEIKDENENTTGLIWNVKAGETATLTFKVTVNAGAVGVISNVAIANGEESDPTETTVVEISKTSEVKSDDVVLAEDEAAKIGDTITYTVSVKNTGTETKTVNVKDVKLQKLINDGILEVEEASKEIADKLISGTDVTVNGGEEVKLTFTTKILKVDGAITNVVVAGDNESEDPEDLTSEDVVETQGLDIEKIVKDTPDNGEAYKYGETVTFEVTVTNTGSTTLTNIKVNDELETAVTTDDETIESLDAGETVKLTYNYVVQEEDVAAGKFVNVATVTSDEDVTDEDTTEEIPVDQIFGYTVNYYKEGTETKLADSKAVEGKKYNDTVTEKAIEINGYNVVGDAEKSLTIDVENNVINFYYTERTDLSYTVNYLEKDTNNVLEEPKVMQNQTFGTKVTENAIKITGYKAVEPLTQEVEITTGENVLNFYYEKDETQTQPTKYTVQHKIGEEIRDSKEYTSTAWVNDEDPMITVEEGSLAQKTYTGYKYESMDPVTTEGSEVASGTVITLTYVKDDSKTQPTKYTVQHKIGEEIRDSQEYTSTAWVNDESPMITIQEGSLAQKTYTGYKYESMDPVTTEGSEVASGTVITLTYVKDDSKTQPTKYTVQHKIGEEIRDSQEYTSTAWVNDESPMITIQEGTVDSNNYPGYRYVSMTPEVSEGDSVASGTVITLTYEPRTDLSYTVRYLEKGTNIELEDPEVVNDQTFGETVTEYAITIEGYSPVGETTKSITIAAEGNEITFYYEAIDVTLTKTAVDSGGREVEPLYQYSEGETVYFKLTVTNNCSAATVEEYTVTDTLTPELSFKGKQPDGTSVSDNTLTWTINDLAAGESESITITTEVNAWQGESNLHEIQPTQKTPSGKGKLMTEREYRWNQNLYNRSDEYCNASFHLYKSSNGEIPHEDGDTTKYPNSNYTNVGFGRIESISYDTTLSSVENLNVVIDQHNRVVDIIEYAPTYDNLEDGQVILWYVAKNEAGDFTINGETGYVKYHVDGIVVDLTNIYTIRNTATGSDGESASDEILAKDNSVNAFTTAKIRVLTYNGMAEPDIDALAEEMKAQEAETEAVEDAINTSEQESNSTENTTTVEETKPEEQPSEDENNEENSSKEEPIEEPSQGEPSGEESTTENSSSEETPKEDETAINSKATEQEKPVVVNNVETSN